MTQRTVTYGNTEFYIAHIDVRQALDESYNGTGPRPPYDERVYAAAINNGASDEWRVMTRRTDRPNESPRVHLVYRTEREALEAMQAIQAEADAHDELLRDMS